MKIETIQHYKNIFEHLACISASRAVKYEVPHGVLPEMEKLKSEVCGATRVFMEAVCKAASTGEPVLECLDLNYALPYMEKAQEYNFPGYTWERLTHEIRSTSAYIDVARAFDDKNYMGIAEAMEKIKSIEATKVNAGVFTASDVYDSVMGLYDDGLRPGVSTGWDLLDRHYTVRECEMTVITGIPGSGKSTWLDALTVNLNQKHGWKIAYCSPENWPIARHVTSIAEKIIKKPFGKSGHHTERASKDEVKKAMKRIDKNFFFAQLKDEQMNIESILNVMQTVISDHGVKGIVLDPWNELEHRRPTEKTETEFVSESLGQIRRFARFFNVHVWIVAHPTKLKSEGKKYPVPKLYDIAGSAAFYNKADNGITVHRPNRFEPKVDIYVQKIRFKEVGRLGRVRLDFAIDTGTYTVSTNQEEEKQETPF